MKIGYARVSTQDQKLELQIYAFEQCGCERIYQEKKSVKNKNCPELEQMLAQLRPGDIVVVWQLDRLAAHSCSNDYEFNIFSKKVLKTNLALAL